MNYEVKYRYINTGREVTKLIRLSDQVKQDEIIPYLEKQWEGLTYTTGGLRQILSANTTEIQQAEEEDYYGGQEFTNRLIYWVGWEEGFPIDQVGLSIAREPADLIGYMYDQEDERLYQVLDTVWKKHPLQSEYELEIGASEADHYIRRQDNEEMSPEEAEELKGRLLNFLEQVATEMNLVLHNFSE